MIKKWNQFNESKVDCVSDSIDFSVLTNLEDERKSIEEGDVVLATYFHAGYDTYEFTIEKWFDEYTGEWMFGSDNNDTCYLVDDAYHIVKKETYNDFISPEKRDL